MQIFRYKWWFVTPSSIQVYDTPERAENGTEWATRPTRCDSFVFRILRSVLALWMRSESDPYKYKKRSDSKNPFPGQDAPVVFLFIREPIEKQFHGLLTVCLCLLDPWSQKSITDWVENLQKWFRRAGSIQSSDQRAILASSTALLRYSSNSTERSEASLFSWYFCTVASHRFQRPFSSWEPNHFSKTETQKIGFNPNKDSMPSLDSNFRTVSIHFICWVQERCFSKNVDGLAWNAI